jgi:hypothetical protein
MKSCRHRARPVVAQGYAMEVYARNARVRAIAYSSTEIRCRCGKSIRSDGNANVRYSANGILFAEPARLIGSAINTGHPCVLF